MGKYRVTATSMRHVTTEGEGADKVKVRTRYAQGDEIEMSDKEAQRLVDAGGLVKVGSDEDTAFARTVDTSTETPETAGAKSGAVANEGDETFNKHLNEGIQSETPDPPKFDVENMEYTELQAAARDLGLPATGSKADLAERVKQAQAS